MNKDISEFDENDLILYLATLANLAICDGLHEREVEFVNLQSDVAGIPHEIIWEEKYQTAFSNLIKLPEMLKKFLLRDALALAYIDGNISLEERNQLNNLTNDLGLKTDDLLLIENWLKEYWSILEKGNAIFS